MGAKHLSHSSKLQDHFGTNFGAPKRFGTRQEIHRFLEPSGAASQRPSSKTRNGTAKKNKKQGPPSKTGHGDRQARQDMGTAKQDRKQGLPSKTGNGNCQARQVAKTTEQNVEQGLTKQRRKHGPPSDKQHPTNKQGSQVNKCAHV